MDKTMLETASTGPMAWVMISGGPDDSHLFRLHTASYIGRESDCDIFLSDTKVSSRHACIRYEHGRYVLYDLASLNHTYLNGRRISSPTSLVDDDRIRIGGTELVFKQITPT